MSDSQPQTAPVHATAPLSTPARILRAFVVTAVALAIGFFIILALVATAPLVRESLKPLVSEHAFASVVAAVLIIAVAMLTPLVILVRLVRRGNVRWPHLAALSALAAGGFAFLIWDDAEVLRPLTMDELAPALPGDQATHDLVLRYAKNSAAANAYKTPQAGVVALVSPRDREKWVQHLRTHRVAIEAGWADLVHVRAWWDEMATHARLGDLTPPRFDAPIPAFHPLRSYSQHASAIAGLKALDGHGDEAADMMLKLYDVARKLEPNSRTLVRSMIAKVIQRMAMETTGFILDHTTVSTAKRAALAQALAAAAGGPAGVRRLVLMEYAYFQPTLSLYMNTRTDPGFFGESPTLRVLGPFARVLVNPNTTQNFVGERYYTLAGDAEGRRLADFEAHTKAIDREMSGYRIKNLGGRLFADMAMPAFSKVVKSYWEIEDARHALLARLKA